MFRKHFWAILAFGTLALGACADGGLTDPSGPATPPNFAKTVKSDSTSSTSTGTTARTTDGYAVAW
jgi:hypothetical protein